MCKFQKCNQNGTKDRDGSGRTLVGWVPPNFEKANLVVLSI
jgi:hypothetical protein